MKKTLIAILIVILAILTYITLAKSISIAKCKVESIPQIKTANQNLKEQIKTANSLADEVYPSKVQSLNESIENLKIAKQKYDAKNAYSETDEGIDTLQVKTYKIHYLWTRLR